MQNFKGGMTMEFSEFVKILEEFYKGGQSQAEFTKNLFLKIAKDEIESEIENRTDHAFIQYYKGNRPIRQIAKIMQYELNEAKFKNYLAQREFNDIAKEKMCQAFEKSAPDINKENLFEKITGIFVKIIENACNEPDRKCKATSNNGGSNISVNNLSDNRESDNESESFYVPISVLDIPKIQEIIIDLSVTVEKLFDLGETIFDMDQKYGHFCANQMNPEIYKKFDNEYVKFVELNNKLRFYNCKCTNETLNNAVLKGEYLNRSSFISNSWILSKDITEYKFDLVRLSSELDEYQSK